MSAMTEPVAIEHLDEAWAVPCDIGRMTKHLGEAPCDRPAEWIAWSVRCCADRSASLLFCEGHRADIAAAPIGYCGHCHTMFAPSIAAFRLIEPLNRRFE